MNFACSSRLPVEFLGTAIVPVCVTLTIVARHSFFLVSAMLIDMLIDMLIAD